MPKSKSPQTAGLTDQIGFKLRMAQLAVFGDFIEALKAFELRPVDFSALLVIGANPGLRQHVVGERLKIARPNIVGLIDLLANRKLVERVVDASDRRAYQLKLTPQGAELLEQAKAVQDEHRLRIMKALEGMDVDNLIRSLDRLAKL